MRVLSILLSLFVLTIAIAAIIVYRSALTQIANYLPEVAIGVLALVGGYILARSRRALATPVDATSTLALSTVPERATMTTTEPSHLTQQLVVSFAQRLVAAASSEELLATLESQMTKLLCGRRVWIAAEWPRAESATTEPRRTSAMLDGAIHEWTTFPLQVEGRSYGTMGVESAGGLSAETKQVVQGLIPLVAQSLDTAQEVQTLREASVIVLLTGAATRREGMRRLQAEVKRAQRAGTPMAVLMLDLDHFKSINDQFGHSVGDSLLTAIGQTLARTLRATDVRCRWGGEEFLIVLPETSLPQAQVVATNLLHSVAATSTASTKGPVSSTASIGLTISRPAETDVDRIVERADLALYQAKHAGRGCIRVVLGGFEGEPVGTGTPRPAPPASNKLPFPDRRNPNRPDRRRSTSGWQPAANAEPEKTAPE